MNMKGLLIIPVDGAHEVGWIAHVHVQAVRSHALYGFFSMRFDGQRIRLAERNITL